MKQQRLYIFNYLTTQTISQTSVGRILEKLWEFSLICQSIGFYIIIIIILFGTRFCFKYILNVQNVFLNLLIIYFVVCALFTWFVVLLNCFLL